MTNEHHVPELKLTCPILPVVQVNSTTHALRIAEGLIASGIAQIEITLRTAAALDAIESVKKNFPNMLVSAGTVLTPLQFDQAQQAGAEFFVSPGFSNKLANHASAKKLAWVPGFATASEMLEAIESNFTTLKFFPAMANGGPPALSAITAAIAKVQIIPTGGIEVDNLTGWKRIPSVIGCGGTWLCKQLEDNRAITMHVTERAKEALNAWNQA